MIEVDTSALLAIVLKAVACVSALSADEDLLI